VPIARTVLREMVGHLIADARPPSSARHRACARRRPLNLNLLGEAVLGEDEAQRRLDGSTISSAATTSTTSRSRSRRS
jgi:RHH-type proline utilization regulon transcriptional repressor/proline dehydrogenase/delta 1-pyrroline-5-carboxylate dehydrogenase